MADKFFEGLWVFILITFFICMVAALGVEFCTSDTADGNILGVTFIDKRSIRYADR